MAPGVGSGHRWLVQVGSQSSALSVATTSYALPQITTVTPPGLLQTRGGQTVVITGSNFGPGEAPANGDSGGLGVTFASHFEVTASYAGEEGWDTYAAACVVTVPHTAIECTTSAGVGVDLSWVVSVGGQVSARSTTTTSYAPPTITEIGGTGAVDGATAGGQRIIINGEVGDVGVLAGVCGWGLTLGWFVCRTSAPQHPAVLWQRPSVLDTAT